MRLPNRRLSVVEGAVAPPRGLVRVLVHQMNLTALVRQKAVMATLPVPVVVGRPAERIPRCAVDVLLVVTYLVS